MPSHYFNQWWDIVNWSNRIKYQWNFNKSTTAFIEKIIFKMFSVKRQQVCLGPDVFNDPKKKTKKKTGENDEQPYRRNIWVYHYNIHVFLVTPLPGLYSVMRIRIHNVGQHVPIKPINFLPNALKTWWRHQMETSSALLAICAGIHRSPVNSPHKGGALMFSLICVWINGWVNSREAGDLRCYRAHYDVTVIKTTRNSLIMGYTGRVQSVMYTLALPLSCRTQYRLT